MATSTPIPTPRRALATPARYAIGLVAGIGIASVANALVAQAAITAGADSSFEPFGIGAFRRQRSPDGPLPWSREGGGADDGNRTRITSLEGWGSGH